MTKVYYGFRWGVSNMKLCTGLDQAAILMDCAADRMHDMHKYPHYKLAVLLWPLYFPFSTFFWIICLPTLLQLLPSVVARVSGCYISVLDYFTLHARLGLAKSNMFEKDLTTPAGESWQMKWESAVVFIRGLTQQTTPATQKYFLCQIFCRRRWV